MPISLSPEVIRTASTPEILNPSVCITANAATTITTMRATLLRPASYT